MVDETRLDDLYEVYTRLNSLIDDLFDKDLINELQGLADMYKAEYEELDDEWHNQCREEDEQEDREFNNGRI